MMDSTEAAQFWDKVDKRGPDDCWHWKRGVGGTGYGVVWVNSKSHRAHRIAWAIETGRSPEGLIIRHKCDTPLCCNPAHLEAGTHHDNMRDRAERGRTATKLTDEDVAAIRAQLRAGVSHRPIAKKFGVSAQTISHINTGVTWRHTS